MSKNIIVCCDGTCDKPDQKDDDGTVCPSNVWQLVCLVDTTDKNGNPQLSPKYLSGVGIDALDLNGKAFGDGVSKKIQEAYQWLGQNYCSGDKIYFFGFSRGAFTVRSLGGMIKHCGLLDLSGLDDCDCPKRVAAAWTAYENNTKQTKWAGDWAFHHQDDNSDNVKIQLLGVWDTVAAIGVPGKIDDWFVNAKFHDLTLPDIVIHARHAVAIDEIRESFAPTLWLDESGTPYGCQVLPAGRTVKQIWFPGVHCNVGGGYKDKGLSDGALRWMLEEAEETGLHFKPTAVVDLHPNCMGEIRDSRTGIFKVFNTLPRAIPPIENSDRIHRSAVDRQTDMPKTAGSYHQPQRLQTGVPVTVQIEGAKEWNDTGLYLEAGAYYNFVATGQWTWLKLPYNPDGSSALVQKEKIEEKVKLFLMPRNRDMDNFSLIGFVGNQGNPSLDGVTDGLDYFQIGNKLDHYFVPRSGYFYGYVNGRWGTYLECGGTVQLTVTRIS